MSVGVEVKATPRGGANVSDATVNEDWDLDNAVPSDSGDQVGVELFQRILLHKSQTRTRSVLASLAKLDDLVQKSLLKDFYSAAYENVAVYVSTAAGSMCNEVAD